MSELIPARELEKWLKDTIGQFRGEAEKLSEEEKRLISNTFDFSFPCQVEIIWLKQPEYQLMIITHFKDLSDMEMIINGPYASQEFIQEMDEVLQRPKWNTVSEDSTPLGRRTYSEGLASLINMFMVNVQNSIFGPSQKSGPYMGMALGKGIWCQAYRGSILEIDYVEAVNKVMEDAKKRQRSTLETPTETTASTKDETQNGFFTFFYPGITIGEIPKPTVSDILRGTRLEFSYIGKVFDTSFKGRDLVVSKSGQIFILESSRTESLKIFNTIMAIATLEDLEFYGVRENELGSGMYDKQKKNVIQGSYSFSSIRMLQGDISSRPFLRSRTVQESRIREIISKAEEVYDDQKLVEELRLYIESFTHLKDSEYGQSFILSWTIIERFLYELWNEKLNEMDIDESRHAKLLNTAQWSADYLLEVLSLTDDISDPQYEEFSELKAKRNRYTHKGKAISREDAERCLTRAREIVLGKLNK